MIYRQWKKIVEFFFFLEMVEKKDREKKLQNIRVEKMQILEKKKKIHRNSAKNIEIKKYIYSEKNIGKKNS